MATVIDNQFEIGQYVYLKTDPEQVMRVVTGIVIRPAGIIYYLTACERETGHYGFEISTEKDIVLKTE